MLEGHTRFLPVMPKVLTPPASYRVGLVTLDKIPDVRLASLLQNHFHTDYHGLNRVWTELTRHGCGDLGVYTRDIAETKISLAQQAAIQQGIFVQFYMAQVPVVIQRGC